MECSRALISGVSLQDQLVSRKFDQKKRRITSKSPVFKVHHRRIRDATVKIFRSTRLMAEGDIQRVCAFVFWRGVTRAIQIVIDKPLARARRERRSLVGRGQDHDRKYHVASIHRRNSALRAAVPSR